MQAANRTSYAEGRTQYINGVGRMLNSRGAKAPAGDHEYQLMVYAYRHNVPSYRCVAAIQLYRMRVLTHKTINIDAAVLTERRADSLLYRFVAIIAVISIVMFVYLLIRG